jgi:hypothetical protein
LPANVLVCRKFFAWQILMRVQPMKLNGAFALLACGLTPVLGGRAATTIPVDRQPATAPYVTPGAIAPAHRSPEATSTLRDREIEKHVIPGTASRPSDRPAALDTADHRALPVQQKNVLERNVQPLPGPAIDRRLAPFSTAADRRPNAVVARFQDSLRTASEANMSRFPAIGPATAAKINRFVFRKNAPDTPLPQPGRSANDSDSVRR